MAQQITYVVGDIHGQLDKLQRLLTDAHIVDTYGHWIAAQHRLWFIGDFFDRGPDSTEAVALAMRLQCEAEKVGGEVHALLGNHDVLVLAARRFGHTPTDTPSGSLYGDWLRNGGNEDDLRALQAEHVAWLEHLPAMARVGDWLFAHADSMLYTRYGDTIEDVNRAFHRAITENALTPWLRLLDEFSEHEVFVGAHGKQRAKRCLSLYGGERLLHGHTPISKVTHQAPEHITEALTYADGRCVNVDGGMYRGGPGFLYVLPDNQA